MDAIYVDEGVQRDPPRRHMGELVAVGGVMTPEEAIAAYVAALTIIRAELGLRGWGVGGQPLALRLILSVNGR
jgi:hypothetical protein